jgi:glycosyltransferase involved in cell wall biosynthesis
VHEQVLALARAGAEPLLLCHGSASPPPAGIACLRVPAAFSPRRTRAGPSAAKLVADPALAALVLRAHRRRPFDALLAHNAEAALVALALRPILRRPVLYVVHTLWGEELECYLPASFAGAASAVGARLDRALAARADGVLVLSEAASERLAPFARGPLRVIPPGLEPAAPPARADRERACARAGVRQGAFALYAGNLDRYQDLDALERAAQGVPELPLLVATHEATPPRRGALRFVRVADADEARALAFAAAVAVLPRRRPGGFPIKLLNYMEAARPIVAHRGVAEGLEHAVSAWLLEPDAGSDALAAALRTLAADPALADRLGARARAVLAERHAWPALAERTLALVAATLPGSRAVPGPPKRR